MLQEYNSQILPVHAALLRTGRLLYFSGSGNDPAKFPDRRMDARVWDPRSGKIEAIKSHASRRDLFCTGHCFLPDGRLLVAGGNSGYPLTDRIPIFTGLPDTFLFDPDPPPGRWLRAADMSGGRWYPTCVALSDGRVMVLSGVWDSLWKAVLPPFGFNNWRTEVWSPQGGLMPSEDTASGHWEDMHAKKEIEYYPRVHLIPSGDLLRVGPERLTLEFDPRTRRWSRVALAPTNRFEGSSVLLPLRPNAYEARILAIGGSRGKRWNLDATNSAAILERTDGEWKWNWVAPMSFRRRHANATLLLDGRVLVTAGGQRAKEEPILETELFDPRSSTWRLGAKCSVGRTYHSVAVLLPDGRVWTGGGNPSWGVDELRIELYTPGYCVGEDRPSIEDSPTNLTYGVPFDIGIKSPTPITEVTLVRPASVTHSFNVDQRWVGLEVLSEDEKRVTVRAPPKPELAPPGWYMLTVLDEHRCPAEVHWAQLAVGF